MLIYVDKEVFHKVPLPYVPLRESSILKETKDVIIAFFNDSPVSMKIVYVD
jgi:hypothetical protein